MFNEKMDPLKVGTSAGLGVPILSVQEMPVLTMYGKRAPMDVPLEYVPVSAPVPDPLLLRILALEARVAALEAQTLGAYWSRLLAKIRAWLRWGR